MLNFDEELHGRFWKKNSSLNKFFILNKRVEDFVLEKLILLTKWSFNRRSYHFQVFKSICENERFRKYLIN